MRAKNLAALLMVIGLLTAASSVGEGARFASAQADVIAEAVGVPLNLASGQPLPAGASADWWSAVQQEIRRSEYHVTWQDHTALSDLPRAYQAPNRAHNVRTYFEPGSIRIIPRDSADENPSWEVRLALAGDSCLANPLPGPSREHLGPTVLTQGNRIEFRHESLTEWYVNDEKGLQHGLTLAQPPAVEMQQAPSEVVLALSGSGDATPRLVDGASAIVFDTASGETVLRYGGITVTDAAGRSLPYSVSLSGSRFSIRIETSAPAYPLTVAARITSPAGSLHVPRGLSPGPDWTAEGDQADAGFGFSVGTAGDVNGDGYSDVIVGAIWFDNGQAEGGQAFLYHGSATGLSLTADWTAGPNQAGARFGNSVGTAGDVNGDGFADVVIGANWYDHGQENEGQAYVYHGSYLGLGATPDWVVESDQTEARLGTSAGTAGDVNGDGYSDVIVGAWRYTQGQEEEGAAFVYYGSASGLNPTANWMAQGDQAYAVFGFSVGTAGDVNGDGFADVIVGAYRFNHGQTDEGRAFVYHGSAQGLSVTPDWTAESNQSNPRFSYTVGTAGDINGDGFSDIIIGAPRYDHGEEDEGAAFVYYGSPNGASLTADWIAEHDQPDARLGVSVGTAGDVNGDGFADVIIGAHRYDGGDTDEGGAFVYYGAASGLSNQPDWTAEGDQAGAIFGRWVETAGDVNGDGFSDVIAGAYLYDGGETDEGAAFVFHGSPDGLTAEAAWTAEGDQEGAWFGSLVGTAGDVNGDGYADLLVGAWQYDNGQTDEGAVFAFHGSADGPSTSPDWSVEGDQANACLGRIAGTAGDVNGDGYADVIVGAYLYDGGETDEGTAYVFHGSAIGLSSSPNWAAEGEQGYAHFGRSVGTAGDVNGDGYADVVVGATRYDDGEWNEGRAFVYHGSANGLSTGPVWTAESDQEDARFGISVGTAGDVNGDGFSDVLIGAWLYDNGQTDEGRAFLYHGSETGLNSAVAWTAESDQAVAWFGYAAGTAGDVNGDGFSDVIVSAFPYSNDQTNEGRVFVYQGSAAGLNTTADWVAEGDQTKARFGRSVGTAGDVNGDGYADVIVGAWYYDNGQTNEGRAFVFHGSAQGLSSPAAWTAESDQAQANLGVSVGTAGDVNGDGYADVVVGARRYTNGQTEEGGAFLYYGNDGDGLDLLPRQMRTDGSVHIAPLGMSDSQTAVQLRLTGRMPLGRDKVRLQWQVAPLGMPFTATGVISGTSAAWTDTLTTGVVLIQNVPGLAPGMPYHWRVRLLYRPGNRLGQAAGRWIHIPWNGWTEQDFRTPDVPIAGLVAVNNSPTVLGDPTTLTATVTAGTHVTFTWALGDGQGAVGDIVMHTYPHVGPYLAVVTASNSVSRLTATTLVIVEEPIVGLVAVNDSPTELGKPTTLTATIAAGSNVSFTWALYNGAAGYGSVVSYTYPAVGTYTAWVTATNRVSTATASTTVTVFRLWYVFLPLFCELSPSASGR